ncbi:hypothetical protein HQ585_05040 [candidate division KSB1 bacterium]|nr:hypothetical protein [candidate division KSB1 bacterium]
MRSRTSLIVALSIILTAGVIAGEKADYSGIWILNEDKCELDDMGTQFLPFEVEIAQKDNAITIQKVYEGEYEDMVMEEILTLDGKECKSEFWNSPRVTTAAYSEDGKQLTIASKITFDRDGEESIMTLKEVISLDEEGKVLKIKHNSSSDWGERFITMILDKNADDPKE